MQCGRQRLPAQHDIREAKALTKQHSVRVAVNRSMRGALLTLHTHRSPLALNRNECLPRDAVRGACDRHVCNSRRAALSTSERPARGMLPVVRTTRGKTVVRAEDHNNNKGRAMN
jgi:hypothetical protein